jgi:hypothetical protein
MRIEPRRARRRHTHTFGSSAVARQLPWRIIITPKTVCKVSELDKKNRYPHEKNAPTNQYLSVREKK